MYTCIVFAYVHVLYNLVLCIGAKWGKLSTFFACLIEVSFNVFRMLLQAMIMICKRLIVSQTLVLWTLSAERQYSALAQDASSKCVHVLPCTQADAREKRVCACAFQPTFSCPEGHSVTKRVNLTARRSSQLMRAMSVGEKLLWQISDTNFKLFFNLTSANYETSQLVWLCSLS